MDKSDSVAAHETEQDEVIVNVDVDKEKEVEAEVETAISAVLHSLSRGSLGKGSNEAEDSESSDSSNDDPSNDPKPTENMSEKLKADWRARHHARRHKVKARGPSQGTVLAKVVHDNFDKVIHFAFAVEHGMERAVQGIIALDAKYEAFMDKHGRHDPHSLLGIVAGLILCFFGQHFALSLSLYEAFLHGGGHTLHEALTELYHQFKNLEVAEVEEEKQEAKLGSKISKSDLQDRRIVAALKAIDPKAVSHAVASFWTAMLASLAAIEMQFTRTISLGMSVGNGVNRPVQRFLIPVLEHVTPGWTHSWMPMFFTYLCKFLGALIAYTLVASYVGPIFAAVKGGHILHDSLNELLEHHGMSYLEGHVEEAVCWGFVLAGLLFQIQVMTELPFVLQVVLWPFVSLEFVVEKLVEFL